MISQVYYNYLLYILDKESFLHTEHWINEVKDLKRNDSIFILLGNKLDLEEKR